LIAIAFAAGPSRPVEAFVRQICEADGCFVLTANASSSGFEICNPPLSSMMLEVAVRAVLDSQGAPTSARLRGALQAADRALSALPPGEDGPMAGWMTAVYVEAQRVQICWAGGDEVWTMRDGRCAVATRAHALDFPAGSGGGPLIRGLGALYRRHGAPEETVLLRSDADPGLVAIFSRTLLRARPAPEIEAALRAERPHLELQRAVERTCGPPSPAPYALAVLISALPGGAA
jgi:hypothetical protein